MSEIERYEPHAAEPAERSTSTPVDSWVTVWRPVVALAEHVYDTDFVPKALRGNAPATAAAMLYGRELGVGPMRSLQTVHMVDGRPTLAAEQMRAMVLAAGHELNFREVGRARCVLAGRRRGQTSYTVVTWTLDDAKSMGLLGKPNWRRSPRQMLVARATGELCRMIFADVIGGAYATEELADGSVLLDPVPGPEDSQPEPRRTIQRASPVQCASAPAKTVPPSAAPELPADAGPPLPDEIDQADEQAAAGDTVADPNGPVTDAQLTHLHTVFSTHGITDRADRLHVARVLIGRDLNSSRDLTHHEASALIDILHTLEAQAGDDFVSALSALMAEAGPDAAEPSADKTTEAGE